MTEHQECAVCGSASDAVSVALCAWRGGDIPFTSEPRCKDVEACRRRLELRGERWPLREVGEPFEPRVTL